MENGEFKDIHINEGDMFLLPRMYPLLKKVYFKINFILANVPHNPVRFENTIGIVIERVRLSHHIGKSDY